MTMYELPYGNTQQLNLDWFIKRWKEFYEEWEQTKTEIDGALDEEVQKVEDAMEDLYAARDAAAASATAAAASAASASNDATIAANAATAAAASATLANTKATAAGLSEAAAALSASQAANDATAAATSASQASASASSATDSAQAAATSEQNIESIIEDAIQDATDAAVAEATADAEAAATAAESSASDAADSATAAAASATAADSSADDAADSATAAAASATAAAGSASDAADSATAAAASAASIVVDSAMSDSSTNPVQNKVINGALTELKTDFTQNIEELQDFCFEDITKTWSDSYVAGNSLSTGNNKLAVDIPNGTDFTFILNTNAVAQNIQYTIYYWDASETLITSQNWYTGRSNTVTASGDIKYISLYSNKTGIVSGDTYTLSVSTTAEAGGENSVEAKMVTLDKISDLLEESDNLCKQSDITDGYINQFGTLTADSDYMHTAKIAVQPNDKIYSNINPLRFVTFYNSSGSAMNAVSITTNTVSPITVPDGAYGAVLSVYKTFNFSGYWNVTIGERDPYRDSGVVSIDGNDINGLFMDRLETNLGNNSVRETASSLSANETVTLTNAPRYSRKNVELSFYAKFQSFTGLTIGKGYQKAYGKGFYIDDTNIEFHIYDNGTDTLRTSVAHGLTISNYISVVIALDEYGIGTVTVNSTSGSFTTTFDLGYIFLDVPFATVEQNSTSVVFTCTTNDIKCPLWIIGDSYCSIADDRIVGQLKNLGYFENMLIDSKPGLRGYDNSYDASLGLYELRRLLAIGKPKYLLWCLGMNDPASYAPMALNYVINICVDYGIELFLYTVPSVPNIPHEDLNTMIKNSGYRYIDGYDAVGCQVGGTWYSGFLASDNVHPTEIGAEALAARFLVDCPEIMQYRTATQSE